MLLKGIHKLSEIWFLKPEDDSENMGLHITKSSNAFWSSISNEM